MVTRKFEKDHPYMIQLDEVLKQFFVVKVGDSGGAKHGEDYEEMKQVILDAFFLDYMKRSVTENDRITDA
tara:strand:- start:365 stop:574 length:210 start_codon:yes stop_codon:yes gene_type:complete